MSPAGCPAAAVLLTRMLPGARCCAQGGAGLKAEDEHEDAEDTARARAAWFHTQTSEGARTWSEFLRDAVMAETARLEAKYNGGDEWPAMRPKEAPQGRPAGS